MGEMEITYLDGMGDSGFGAATVHTNVRAGYASECPNVGKFLSNLKFSAVDGEPDHGRDPEGHGRRTRRRRTWLKANPDAVTPWLEGVTTFDGGDAKAAVEVGARRANEARSA